MSALSTAPVSRSPGEADAPPAPGLDTRPDIRPSIEPDGSEQGGPSLVSCSTNKTQATRLLACAQEASEVSVDCADAEELAAVVGAWRKLQAVVDAGLVAVGLRAEVLAAAGAGAPAQEALSELGRVRGVTARREAARSRLARRSEALAQAMTSGMLGVDHLDVCVRHLGRLDDEHLAAVEAVGLDDWLRTASALPVSAFDVSLRRLVEEVNPREPDDAAGETGELRTWFDHRTGLGHLSATFDPERYEAIVAAIDVEVAQLAAKTGRPKSAALAAESLAALVCSSGVRRQHHPLLHVIVDEQTLVDGRHARTIAETGDGHSLTDAAVARLCCDAVIQRVRHDQSGRPIDVGRRFRTATSAQWAAIRSVHRSCGWDGCDQPLSRCQIHHLRHWRDGGPTDFNNLLPLCDFHHHLVHDNGWVLESKPDHSICIRRPDGTHHATAQPPTRRPPTSPTGSAATGTSDGPDSG